MMMRTSDLGLRLLRTVILGEHRRGNDDDSSEKSKRSQVNHRSSAESLANGREGTVGCRWQSLDGINGIARRKSLIGYTMSATARGKWWLEGDVEEGFSANARRPVLSEVRQCATWSDSAHVLMPVIALRVGFKAGLSPHLRNYPSLPVRRQIDTKSAPVAPKVG
jgi:hypothetical protein